MTFVAWFAIATGVAIAGLWTMLLATRQVPELVAGRRDIRFHLGAELLTAALLVGAGVALLVAGGATARLLAGVASGALLYTTINSPGHYADVGQWQVVAMFAVLAGATVAAILVLVAGTAS